MCVCICSGHRPCTHPLAAKGSHDSPTRVQRLAPLPQAAPTVCYSSCCRTPWECGTPLQLSPTLAPLPPALFFSSSLSPGSSCSVHPCIRIPVSGSALGSLVQASTFLRMCVCLCKCTRTHLHVCVVPIYKEIEEELGEQASWRKSTDFILGEDKGISDIECETPASRAEH